MSDSMSERLAGALLEHLFPDIYTERWNVEVVKQPGSSSFAIEYCDGEHEKGEGCKAAYVYIDDKSPKQYTHRTRGSSYTTLCTGEVQNASGTPIEEGDMLIAYKSNEDGKVWFRKTSEFHDGRFTQITPSHKAIHHGSPISTHTRSAVEEVLAFEFEKVASEISAASREMRHEGSVVARGKQLLLERIKAALDSTPSKVQRELGELRFLK